MVAEPGTSLAGRYLVGRLLGRGGAADVHRGEDTVLGRPVALKVLRDVAGEGSDHERFVAEARTLARLTHPGLVTVLDAGTETDQPFLVLELVEGESLATRIARGPLRPEDVRRIGAALASALAYAHDQGIVHRDVKPGNVLLAGSGTAMVVKLADFGIARVIGDTVRHTRTGHAIGTAAYLSPEQVLGEELTTAADLYSLGLVLLEALTGERAYPGPVTEAALARLSRQPELPPSLPREWPALLGSLTARDPALRPTAAEAAALLSADPATAVLTDATLVAAAPAPPPSSPPVARSPLADRAGDALAGRAAALTSRVREAEPHHWVLAGALTLLLLIFVVAAIASGGDATPEDPAAPSSTASRTANTPSTSRTSSSRQTPAPAAPAPDPTDAATTEPPSNGNGNGHGKAKGKEKAKEKGKEKAKGGTGGRGHGRGR